MFDNEITALKILISNYEQMEKTDVHPRFLEKLKAIMKKDYCQRVNDTRVMLRRQLKASNPAVYQKKEKEAEKVKETLIEKGLDENMRYCL